MAKPNAIIVTNLEGIILLNKIELIVYDPICKNKLPENIIYIEYDNITIIPVAIIGFINHLIMFIFSFTVLTRTVKLIENAIIWQTTVANAAPAAPPKINTSVGICVNTTFNIAFAITPNNKAIAGTKTFPNPCNAPLIVWIKAANTIAIAQICKTNAPYGAFGNNNSKIG